LISNLVEGLMGLVVFLHQQETEGCEDLAIKVLFHEGLLNAVGDRVIWVDVCSDSVSDITGDMGKDVSFGGDGERDRFKVRWREKRGAYSRAVVRRGREQATRPSSGRCLGEGRNKLSHFVPLGQMDRTLGKMIMASPTS
jgi:hypothetical protein